MSQMLRFFSAEDVGRAVSVKEAIPLVREAFIQLSSQQACVPLRTKIDVTRREGTVLYMPVYLPARELLVVKVVSLFKNNEAAGLPLIHATVMVNDARTGCTIAVMDGERLTAIRTAAATALATDLLARRETEVAAIFGAGVQGRAQLEALCVVRPIREVYVFDRDLERAEVFCREMGEKLSLALIAANSPSQLLHADVICTVTTWPTLSLSVGSRRYRHSAATGADNAGPHLRRDRRDCRRTQAGTMQRHGNHALQVGGKRCQGRSGRITSPRARRYAGPGHGSTDVTRGEGRAGVPG